VSEPKEQMSAEECRDYVMRAIQVYHGMVAWDNPFNEGDSRQDCAIVADRHEQVMQWLRGKGVL
jgi:hypothetical protein